MTAPLVVVNNASYWIGGRSLFAPGPALRAVTDVSLTVGRGEVVGLVGESGSGKSTMGRIITAEIMPQRGEVLFDGVPVTTFAGRRRKELRRRAQVVFQDPYSSLDPRRTIGAQISDGPRIHKLASHGRAAAIGLLESVGLSGDHIDRRPSEFSGGQRQRIAIARALSTDPDFIVADEAVSALDVSVQAQIIALLLKLKRERGLSMLFISHDLAVVRYISDSVLVMYLGRIVERAPTARIFERPRHPYTRSLLAASPKLGAPASATDAEPIGEPPSPFNPPSGCVFRTRCPFAIADCARVVPSLTIVDEGHESACIRPDVMK